MSVVLDANGYISRIVKGVLANGYGQAVSILLQIIGTPFLIHTWGLNGFGLWTIITTIPLLLISMDFGIAAASAGLMIKAISAGDTEEASRVFLVGFVSSSAILALTFLTAAVWWWLSLIFPSSPGNQAVIFAAIPISLIYVGVSVISGIVNAGYRANGFYSRGVLIYENGRLLEQLSVICFAVFGGNIIECLILMTVFRAIATAFSLFMLVRMTPWIDFGRKFDGKVFRSMIQPALSAMLVPTTQALSIQGMTFVVGTALSPAAAAVFSTARILSRTLVQFSGILTRAAAPEFALALGRGELLRASQISWSTTGLTLIATVLGGAIISVFGQNIIALWISVDVKPDVYVLASFCIYGVLNASWTNISALLTSINQQSSYAPIMFLSTLSLTVLSLPTVQAYGYLAACLVMVAIEGACLASVIIAWKRRLKIPLLPLERQEGAGR